VLSRALVALVACASLLVGESPAAADAAPPLAWSAPEGCPDRASLEAAIERLLGEPIAKADRAPARAEVAADAGGFALRVTMGGDAGRARELRAATCAEAADAAALVIALAWGEGARAPPPVAHDAARPAREARTTRAAPPATAERVRGRLSVLAAFEAGPLPSIAPGFGVALGVSRGPLRGELFGEALLEQRATLEGGAAGGDLALYVAGLRACWSALSTPIELAPCAGLEAGGVRGAGFGVPAARSATSPWLSPFFGLSMEKAFLDPWLAGLRVEALVPLVRERFLLGSTELHRPSPLAARLELTIGARWP
jgi:hypothetical protein